MSAAFDLDDILDEPVAPLEPMTADGPLAVDSWLPIDIGPLLADGYEPPVPTVFALDTGIALFYKGQTNDVHGESESGKSWIAQASVAETLIAGGRALYLDFESDARSVAGRLILLGVPIAVVTDPARFVYVSPEVSPDSGASRDSYLALLGQQWDVTVLDGVTNALMTLGLNGREEDGIAKFYALLPDRFAKRTGAAVIQVDHVTKSKDGRGRMALGSQHKLSSISGASYVVEMKETMVRGRSGGLLEVKVAKDRIGSVRAVAGPRQADGTQHIANIRADYQRTPEGELLTLRGFAYKAEGSGDQPWRPTHRMEQLSKVLESALGKDDEWLSQKQLIDAVEGKTDHKKTALDRLTDGKFVERKSGPRNSWLYRSVSPFRESQEPGL